jgi:hypothetical protein
VAGGEYSAKYHAQQAATSATNSANSATASANSAALAASVVASAVSGTLFDAKGDLLVGTADDTVARLPVGANGYVLVADSAETPGIKWAAPSTADITAVTAGTGLSGGGTSGDVTVSLNTSSVYVVPSQTGHTGKFLTTDGTSASWVSISDWGTI